VIVGTALALGWLLGRLVPLPLPAVPWAPWLGGALVVAAFCLAGAALRHLWRAGTAVDPYRPTRALVCTGPYALSRNPLYVALLALALGVALLLAQPWCVLALLPAQMLLRFGVVAREEAYLHRRFGAAYARYVATTRRWL
jgi:protein-S-isoprenylcysteine O-methyltransferase Ste14